jgi:hypothetical protein
LALAFPAAAGGREGRFYTHLVECRNCRPNRTVSEEENTMTYTKPEVAFLGKAALVIEFFHLKLPEGLFDGPFPQFRLNPAYDLDE